MNLHKLVFALLILTSLVSIAQAGSRKVKKEVAPTLPVDLQNEIFVILERATRSPDMETRALAVENIVRVKPETLKDYVIDALKDPQWVVRKAAMTSLIRQNNPEYRVTLARSLTNAALLKDKHSALDLLLLVPEVEAGQLLVEVMTKTPELADSMLDFLLKNDRARAMGFLSSQWKEAAVKAYIFKHLDLFNSPEDFPRLAKVIPSMSDDDAIIVLAGLETMAPGLDMPFLKKMLASKNEKLAEAAARVAAVRGDRAAVNVLLPLCDLNDPVIQVKALDSLQGVASDPEVIERAKLFMFGEPDPRVLHSTYRLLSKAGIPELEPRILAQTSSTNPGIRLAAVSFLGDVAGTRALPTLQGLLADGNVDIKMAAIAGIGKLRQAESVPHLENALIAEPNPVVKRAIVTALGDIGDRSIINVVSFLITDPEVKHEAVVALSKVPHKDALLTLQNILNNSFTLEERAIALEAILKIDAAGALSVFRSALGWLPPDFLSRMAGELGESFLPHLGAALASIHADARKAAVMAFSKLPVDKEVEVLEKELFTSKHADLTRYILIRLAELKREAELPLLESFFSDKDLTIRLEAIRLAGRYSVPGSPTEIKLREQLMDGEESVRVQASVSLVNIFLK